MKKIIVLLIAVTSFSSVFSQDRYDRNRNNNHSRDRYSDHERSGNISRNTNDYWPQTNANRHELSQNDGRYNDRVRQTEIDCVNHDYDQRIYSYKNDHSINRHKRERKIRQAEAERSERIRSFGSGAIIGAVTGFVLGTFISH